MSFAQRSTASESGLRRLVSNSSDDFGNKLELAEEYTGGTHRRSLVWYFFKDLSSEECQCKVCGERILEASDKMIKRRYHLETRHNENLSEFPRLREEYYNNLVSEKSHSRFIVQHRSNSSNQLTQETSNEYVERERSNSASQKRYKLSPVWRLFHDKDGLSTCLLCHQDVKNKSTTELLKHLMLNHEQEFDDVVQDAYVKYYPSKSEGRHERNSEARSDAGVVPVFSRCNSTSSSLASSSGYHSRGYRDSSSEETRSKAQTTSNRIKLFEGTITVSIDTLAQSQTQAANSRKEDPSYKTTITWRSKVLKKYLNQLFESGSPNNSSSSNE